MAIGPSDGGISLEGTQDIAVKRPCATNIKPQADREDSKPDLSSSDSIKHAERDQMNHPTVTGCRIRRGGVRREEVTRL